MRFEALRDPANPSVAFLATPRTLAPWLAQAKTAAKKAVKEVKKATPSVGGGARKTVRSRAGWWGDVRPRAQTRDCTMHAQHLQPCLSAVHAICTVGGQALKRTSRVPCRPTVALSTSTMARPVGSG